MKGLYHFFILIFYQFLFALPELPGGGFTSDFSDRDSVQLPAPKITNPAKRARQIAGFVPFHTSFSRREGLGPLFSNSSCGGCHLNNFKGPVDIEAKGEFGSSAVLRIGFLGSDGKVRKFREWNGQVPLGDKRFVRDLGIKVSRISVGKVTLSDGKVVNLSKYEVRLNPRRNSLKRKLTPRRGEKLLLSIRVSPPMIGMGLIEAIPEDVILAWADPNDADGDGIRGRVNYVKDIDGVTKVGKFGLKAQHPSLMRQIAFAFFMEMGLENEYFKRSKVEVSETTLREVFDYLKYAGVPKPVFTSRERYSEGYQVFKRLGCESCHKANIQIFGNEEEEFNNELISPFSDFLLHDLGSKMCDPFKDGRAHECEWRTAPLWGLSANVRENGRVSRHYLHDGRARSLEEAILWHEGEASLARRNFIELSREERQLLLDFLNSL